MGKCHLELQKKSLKAKPVVLSYERSKSRIKNEVHGGSYLGPD